MTLLIVFLLWIPVALIVNAAVKNTEGFLTTLHKTVLIYIITFPVIWIDWVNKMVGNKVKDGFLGKIGRWFKS